MFSHLDLEVHHVDLGIPRLLALLEGHRHAILGVRLTGAPAFINPN